MVARGRDQAPFGILKINCLEPWLFAANAEGATQEEQHDFYRKVWRPHAHCNQQLILIQHGKVMTSVSLPKDVALLPNIWSDGKVRALIMMGG